MLDKIEIAVIGAGIVGLATSLELAKAGRRVVLIERHESFGRETSSRSSEVVHAGIYYEPGSFKARLCVEGNRLIYDICAASGIKCLNIGKLIVARKKDEEPALLSLQKIAEANGVEGLRIITKSEVKRMEPNIEAVAAMHVPSSGIVDSHNLMKYFESEFSRLGGAVAYGCELIGIEKGADNYILSVRDSSGDNYSLVADFVVNSSGLSSDNVSKMAGIDIDEADYKISYFKGFFYSMPPSKAKLSKMLLYPVPPFSGHVGAHTVPDTGGGNKLGPWSEYVDEVNYEVDATHIPKVFSFLKPMLPFIELDELAPAMAGIQAKLQKKGGGFRDFVIKTETDRGLKNFINLVGIDSPGLTSSPAIAKMVERLVSQG